MSSQKKTSRLEGKDLITIGIYTVIYVVIVMLVAMIGFIPIFIPLMAVLCPLIGGIPYMLYVTKAKKFGMTAIMGFLIGLIMVFFGNGYLTFLQNSKSHLRTWPEAERRQSGGTPHL
ncbi:MptD family putative ECF transporter S component [Flavonifractor sp. An82]|uniref:MptD family putative ECF transporter S component n=1 Tax=Flavonifractor sp. An82 TaxID=1965660 RepID=UPI001FA903B4|nr:MptD family putative ECF transporter S component [Flavonifractor sp. An82]